MGEAPTHADKPYVAGAAKQRVTDMQALYQLVPMYLEVFAVREIQLRRWKAVGIVNHAAVFIGDKDGTNKGKRFQAIAQPFNHTGVIYAPGRTIQPQ